jgi:anti-sigma regulatory factor (Ser/Thr protein kinase)
LHTAAIHVLLRELNELDYPLTDMMRWLNRRTSEYFEDGTFAGALVFEVDMETRQMRWACAGIPEVFVSTRDIKGVIAKPGMYLSIRDDETFEMHSLPFSVGDSFYFMTDGLSDIIQQNDDLPLERFPDMVTILKDLSESAGCRDDATAVCIHIKSLATSLNCENDWPCVLHFSSYGDYLRIKPELSRIIAVVIGTPHSFQEVAINEALANALECRDGIPRQHKVRIKLNRLGRWFIVRVRTSRMGFAGNAVLRRLRSHPEEAFEFVEDASMGRGIPIMLSLSQKMLYNSEGTEVLMAWRLNAEKC